MNRILYTLLLLTALSLNATAQLITTQPVITSPTCHNTCDGSVTLNVAGGIPPFNYVWNNGQTTPVQTNLCAGVYIVTITDVQFNSKVDSIIVTAPTPINVLGFVEPDRCQGNGRVTVTANGGTPFYTYTWSNGSINPNLFNIPTGVYTLTITDASGCTATESFFVPDSSMELTATTINPTCGQSNGSIMVDVTRGVSPFSYRLDGNSPQPTNEFTNLPEGNYTVRVTDSSLCVQAINIALSRVQIIVDKVIPADCNNTKGEIMVKAVGGNPPYTFAWSNGASGPNVDNLSIGGYSVTVTDSSGCSSHKNVLIEYASNCVREIAGQVFYDVNANCKYDSTDALAYNKLVRISSAGTTTWVSVNNDGFYAATLPLGFYTIEPVFNPGETPFCPAGGKRQVDISVIGSPIDTLDFAIEIIPVRDASVQSVSAIARPGFTANVWVTVKNHSNIAHTQEGTATLALDSRTTPITAHTGGSISGNTITWNYSLAPGASKSFMANIQIAPPPIVEINDTLVHIATITPTTIDDVASNNTDTLRVRVQGSYDPNDKLVNLPANILAKDTVFKYTIRFQNTGTDTAFTVVIRDTLDLNLNPYTFRNFTSSHPMTPVFVTNDIIEFRFDNIYLVDSFTNEPLSHGFVTFFINRLSAIPVGTSISNSASIYFDYNLPIKTNTVVNTLVNPSVGIEGVKINGDVRIFPNPSRDRFFIQLPENMSANTLLYDLSGKHVAATSTNELHVSSLPVGMYLCKVQLSNGEVFYTRLMIQ